MLSYYITDRTQFAGSEAERREKLLQAMGRASAAGVDYVQLREKDLAVRELEALAQEALRVMRGEGTARFLINHRTDVALAVGADGVHLTGDDIAASEARALAAKVNSGRWIIAASCHSVEEVRRAESHGADFVVLAPIFEKASAGMQGIGLGVLSEAARKGDAPDARVEAGDFRRRMAVFALGGVSRERVALCAEAGAAGVAGIRLFQECEDLRTLVREIRG